MLLLQLLRKAGVGGRFRVDDRERLTIRRLERGDTRPEGLDLGERRCPGRLEGLEFILERPPGSFWIGVMLANPHRQKNEADFELAFVLKFLT